MCIKQFIKYATQQHCSSTDFKKDTNSPFRFRKPENSHGDNALLCHHACPVAEGVPKKDESQEVFYLQRGS